MLAAYCLLFLPGCFIFKKKCDCPKVSRSKGIDHPDKSGQVRPLTIENRPLTMENKPMTNGQ